MKLLTKEFPDIINFPSSDQEIKHSVMHHIQKTWSPVIAKARNVEFDLLHISKHHLFKLYADLKKYIYIKGVSLPDNKLWGVIVDMKTNFIK